MYKISLGHTGLEATSVSFGALPIQRAPLHEAVKILRRAHEAGVAFFDTARAYSDSEEKLGAALADVRKDIIIASKTKGGSPQEMEKDLETTLKNLRTDYLDLWQLHNPACVPEPGDGSGVYETLLAAKKFGKVRHIGITAHLIGNALRAVESGFYETLQFPFSMLSTGRDLDLPARCRDAGMGFIAMKSMAGGLVRNVPAAFAFMRRHAGVVPIWGIQRMEELEQFLALDEYPPIWDASMEAAAEADRLELGKDFCRGCGYCQPCPEDIPISMLARMRLFLGRSPWKSQYTPQLRQSYARAEACTRCGLCASRCPYELDTPRLVEENYSFYVDFLRAKQAAGEI